MNVENAKYLLAVANNARFLYSRLRKDAATETLVHSKTASEILDWLEDKAGSHPGTIDELVEIYVHLAALSLLGSDVPARIAELKMPFVQWARHFIAFIRKPVEPTTRIVVNPLSFAPPSPPRRADDGAYTRIGIPRHLILPGN